MIDQASIDWAKGKSDDYLRRVLSDSPNCTCGDCEVLRLEFAARGLGVMVFE